MMPFSELLLGQDMELSLILATYNNAGSLRDLLDRLTECRQPDDWEMIIVDNGSTDNTADLVQNYANQLPVKYLYEGKKGKSRALNLGIRHARGEIILFTDDDIIPDHDWLTNHICAMRAHPQVNIVGGRITVDPSSIPPWLARSYNLRGILVSEHDKGDIARLYAAGDYPFGPNMSVRRRLLEGHVNPWPEEIGPGTRIPVGDETGFCRNISTPEASDRLYDPDCIVQHVAGTDRYFLISSIKRCFIGGYTVALFSLPASLQTRDSGSLFRFIIMRLFRLRSIQECICVTARVMGYLWGKTGLGRMKSRNL